MNGLNTSFRWNGEGWIGTDFNKLWIESEGRVMNGVTSDGDHEFLYDRPQSAYKDLLPTSLVSRQRCMFAMEDASREESQARTICTSLNA
jgi:hypothetical protein